MDPVVSVIMPIHNGETTLAEAIQSILSQTFSDFELIAIDDGSTDRTLDILKSFADRDKRVITLSRPTPGLPAR